MEKTKWGRAPLQLQKNMRLASRANSFLFAFNGFRILSREPNIIIHLIAATGVTIAGIVTHLSPQKWIAIVFAVAIVLVAEALNTGLEKLCDFTCDNKWSQQIKAIKDVAAAAVLLASAGAVITGVIVFFFWN